MNTHGEKAGEDLEQADCLTLMGLVEEGGSSFLNDTQGKSRRQVMKVEWEKAKQS